MLNENLNKKVWNNFLFEDEETGEEFIVAVEEPYEHMGEKDAMKIARANFESPVCRGWIDEEYADWLGLDTY